jgi:hypothetical protein
VSEAWGAIIGGAAGLALSWVIILVTYRLRLRHLRRRKPAVRFDVDPSRFILEDPLARHVGHMSPDMLAELRLRISDRNQVRHLDGVSWLDAPVPRRRHSCWVQTWGTLNWFTDVYRCPCGGINRGDGWFEKNARKVSADA